jgi:hypothetical protein
MTEETDVLIHMALAGLLLVVHVILAALCFVVVLGQGALGNMGITLVVLVGTGFNICLAHDQISKIIRLFTEAICDEKEM